MSYYSQLKVFIWKNKKTFLRRSPLFVLCTEVLVSVVAIFSFRPVWYELDKRPSKFINYNSDSVIPLKLPFLINVYKHERDRVDFVKSFEKRNFPHQDLVDDYIDESAYNHNAQDSNYYPLDREDFEYKKPQFSTDSYDENGEYIEYYDVKSGTIAFILPKDQSEYNGDDFIKKVMSYSSIKENKHINYKIFNDEKELFKYMNEYALYSYPKQKRDEKEYIKIVAAVIFHEDYYHYTIRLSNDQVPDAQSELMENAFKSFLTQKQEIYFYYDHNVSRISLTNASRYLIGFVPLQLAVDNAILAFRSNSSITASTTTSPPYYNITNFIEFNEPEDIKITGIEDKVGDFSGYIPLVPLIFIFQMIHLSNRIMEEKESKTKDGLVAIGAHRSLFWLSWEIIYFPLSLFVMILILALNPSHIFNDIHFILYLINMILYCISVYQLTVIFTHLFKKSNTCNVVLIVLAFFIVILNKILYLLKRNGYGIYEKIFSIFFSPTNFSMAHVAFNNNKLLIDNELYTFDNKMFQISFNNIMDRGYGQYLIYLVFDIVLYSVIIFVLDYLEGAQRSYSGKANDVQESPYLKDIQKDPSGAELMVQVQNITKYFSNRNSIGRRNEQGHENSGKLFAANDHISFNAYKGEIFAILGHNGSGKSTLIQNMVGIHKPDGGDTFYNGQAMSKNKKNINLDIGICLQDNILFKEFTPGDNYKIFAGIKGIENTSEEDIDAWLRDIGLYQKKLFAVSDLSGGQLRKLCIGLAFIGNPKYVFLDEPTTGLDPLSRRHIWNLLQKKKKDRVIFICTHYMDEADIIADRKLILKKGVIRCMGDSIYLKNHFGMNYNLEIETNAANIPEVDTIVKRHIPEAHIFNDKTQVRNLNNHLKSDTDSVSALLTPNSNGYALEENTMSTKTEEKAISIWKLPIYSSSFFPALFDDLAQEKCKGRIDDYSINSPMLEELFVNLEREHEVKGSSKAVELPNMPDTNRPGILRMALRFTRYRFSMYFRSAIYISIGIFVPFILSISIFYIFNKEAQNQFFNVNGESDFTKSIELNPNLYREQLWNYQYEDSNLETRISNATLAHYLTPDPAQELYTFNTKVMRNIMLNITREPYFVSSIAGTVLPDQTLTFNLHFNHSMTHGIPSTINGLSNAILSTLNVNQTIHTYNKPLFSINLEIEKFGPTIFYVTLILLVSLGFAFSFYGTNIVHERVGELLKQLQLNGMNNKSYWISVFITDFSVFSLTVIMILLGAIIVRFIPLQFITLILITFVIIIISSMACILLQYCLSFLFNHESKSYIVFASFNILASGFLLYTFYGNNLDKDFSMDTSSVYILGAIEFVVGVFLPNFNICRLMKNIMLIGLKHKYYNYPLSLSNIFKVDNMIIIELGTALVSLLFYLILLHHYDHRYNYPNPKAVYKMSKEIDEKFTKEIEEADEDVRKEHERVMADHELNRMPIRMERLTMEYLRVKFKSGKEITDAIRRKNAKYGEYHISNLGNTRVVSDAFHNISIGVDPCECFGLLGPNGSGKTSLLSTAALNYQPCLGSLYYDGKDTRLRKSNTLPIGYCPQFDTLWEGMTLYEHIEMFLYLQGYSKSESKQLALHFIDYCRLTAHKNKLPSELSGGTRRKLTILMALCNNTSRILLDEPTAGMDPSTRRYVWDMLKSTIQHRQSSTIMTTHSMEEAELLCNRIGIMVNGKLHCIGTPQHLKLKYGNKYILDVLTDHVERFDQEVVRNTNLFNGCDYERKVKSLERVEYEVCDARGDQLSRVFKIMEEKRHEGLFTEYSYSKTTLEQVFLDFASLKEISDEDQDEEEKDHEISINVNDNE